MNLFELLVASRANICSMYLRIFSHYLFAVLFKVQVKLSEFLRGQDDLILDIGFENGTIFLETHNLGLMILNMRTKSLIKLCVAFH